MTIAEFAKLAGRTPQAIYQRLKENNIKLSELKADDGKTLTPDGLSVLASLFSIKEKEIDLTEEIKASSGEFEKKSALFEKRIAQLVEENTQLKMTLAEIRATAAAKDELIAALTARAEFAEKISLQRLPGEAAPRPSLWERITRRKPKEAPENSTK